MTGKRARALAVALLGFAAQKAAFLLVSGASGLGTLYNWDAYWYASVVDDGYVWPGTQPSPTGPLSNIAFFPLYPMAARAVAAVTGLATPQALFVVAWAATLAAVVGIFWLGCEVAGSSVGVLLVLLWGGLPRAAVQLMPYSEPLFVALVAWGLWAVVRTRSSPGYWWLAGTLCCLAGLTRPAALPFMATLWVMWLVELVRRRRAGASWSDAIGWHRLGAATLGTAGFAAFWAYVGWRVGDLFGYLTVQRDWGTALGSPLDTLSFGLGLADSELQFTVGPLAVLIGYTALLVWAVRARVPWQLVVFGGLVVVLVWCQQGYFHSKPRFLLPAFVLLLPLAGWLAKAPRWVRWLVVTAATAGSVAWDVLLAGSLLAP